MPDIVFPPGFPPPHKKTAAGNALVYPCGRTFTPGCPIMHYIQGSMSYASITNGQQIPMEDGTTVTASVTGDNAEIGSISS